MIVQLYLPKQAGRPNGADNRGALFCVLDFAGDGTPGTVHFPEVPGSLRWQSDDKLQRLLQEVEKGLQEPRAERGGGMEADGESVITVTTSRTHQPWTLRHALPLAPGISCELQGVEEIPDDSPPVYVPRPGFEQRFAAARETGAPTEAVAQTREIAQKLRTRRSRTNEPGPSP